MRDNRKSDEKLEELMKAALTSKMEPDAEINRQILRSWKEQSDMKNKKRKSFQIAVAAMACVMLTGVTVGATVRYMNASEVADKMGQGGIADAFRGEDAVSIGESREEGDYRITLLGITTGEELTQASLSEELAADRKSTYAAVAIERLDGTPMPSASDEAYGENSFFISPLIQGLAPWQYNIASMNGGYCDIVENGILYRLIECDDIMLFADRELYLCVSDTAFFDTNAYSYDETNGKITANEAYDGINVLFDLPIDPAKADETAAAEYLKALEEEWASDSKDAGEEVTANEESAAKLCDQILALIKEGRIEEATAGAKLTDTDMLSLENGAYSYSYASAEDGIENTGTYYFYPEDFADGYNAMINYNFNNEGEIISLTIMIVHENGDNTAAVEVYERPIETD